MPFFHPLQHSWYALLTSSSFLRMARCYRFNLVYIYIYIYIHTHIYIHAYYWCVCMCIYIYIYIYIYSVYYTNIIYIEVPKIITPCKVRVDQGRFGMLQGRLCLPHSFKASFDMKKTIKDFRFLQIESFHFCFTKYPWDHEAEEDWNGTGHPSIGLLLG